MIVSSITIKTCQNNGYFFVNISKSIFQAWNQLSRLQRNLLYLLFIILAFACFWNITRLKSHPKNLNGSKDESSLLSNVDQLINNRIKEIDDEVV